MKVFAELVTEGDVTYRKRTVLQFGNSWDLIGSIVLKNPGSATPIKPINQEDEHSLKPLIKDVGGPNWYEFKPDPTMGFIEKVFNGHYVGNKTELNGVILLFNLYNIKDPKIVAARKLAESNLSDHLYSNAAEVIPYFQDKPVFLGWYFEYLRFNKEFAEQIFNHVKNSKHMYLESDMIDNYFYHPGYIQTQYTRNLGIMKTLQKFHVNIAQ